MYSSQDSNVSVFHRTEKNYKLLFLGTTHTLDPKSATIAEVKRLFDAFKPTTVLVEGGKWDIASNAEEAVTSGGEMAYATYLASQIKASTRSLELEPKQEVASLLERYSVEEIKLYYALRMVPIFLRQKTPHSIDKRMDTFLEKDDLGANPALAGPPSNSNELDKVFKARFPHIGDWRTYDSWSASDPISNRTVKEGLAEIDKYTHQIRDDHMEKVIRSTMSENRRVLVIAGMRHLAALYMRLGKD